jgi:biotin operon repressor
MTMPIVGEPFNPWHEACGFWPEDVVDRQRDLGDGPKRVYRKLRRYAGTKGSCFPSQKTLADELGKGERQVRRDLDALEAAGLIASVSRDGRRSNTYVFLWHAMFEQTSMSAQATNPSGHGCPVNDAAAEHSEPYPSARDRTDMTGVTGHPCPPNPFSESLQGKSKQAAAGALSEFAGGSAASVPRKPASGSSSELASEVAGRHNEERVEGFSEMQALLAGYHVRAEPGEIALLIESGRKRGLTLKGVFAFVEDKLKEKREQGDAVYSTRLLIKAISSETDLHRWISKSYRCNSYFERTATRAQAPFSLEELTGHLSSCSKELRVLPEYCEIAAQLDLLAVNVDGQNSDLQALDQRLTQLEADMIAIARSHQTEADAMQVRQELDRELRPYREKMTKEQIAMLESQFLERKLLELFDLPRLSLFYFRPSRAAA